MRSFVCSHMHSLRVNDSWLSLSARGPGISPGYYEHGPRLLSWENTRKIEPKEIASCMIPFLLAVFTQQLEILMTALNDYIL